MLNLTVAAAFGMLHGKATIRHCCGLKPSCISATLQSSEQLRCFRAAPQVGHRPASAPAAASVSTGIHLLTVSAAIHFFVSLSFIGEHVQSEYLLVILQRHSPTPFHWHWSSCVAHQQNPQKKT
jgi:hypothetical protein